MYLKIAEAVAIQLVMKLQIKPLGLLQRVLHKQMKIQLEIPEEKYVSPEKGNELLMSLDQYNM